MKLTNQLRKRFCKENGVPIAIYEEPYFSDRLELYARVLPVRDK